MFDATYDPPVAQWPGLPDAPFAESRAADPFFMPGLLASMLDEIDYGLVVLDGAAAILFANHLARQELARAYWVQQTGHRFEACDETGALKIDRAMCDIARAQRSLISLDGEAGSLALSFVPLTCAGTAAAPQTAGQGALVAFSKRAACEVLTLRMFGEMHGLSIAENELLPAISCGLSVETIALQQHVAVSTVRSQVYSIRAKTGSTSLRTLMARLITLPPIRPALKTVAV